MKKILSTLTALAAALTLTACAKTEETSSEISDPFSDLSAPDPDSGAWDDNSDPSSSAPVDENEYFRALSNCVTGVAINTTGAVVYDGEPVKVPIAVTVHERNSVNCSTGVSVFINGLAQEISANGVNYDYMVVYDDLEPGMIYETELYLKPSVLPGDKGKDMLDVEILECPNAAFKPRPPHYAFWGTHWFDDPLLFALKVNKNILNIVEPVFETEYTSKPAKQVTHEASDIMPNDKFKNEYELLFLNEDGSLSATYEVQNAETGMHRLIVLVDDKPVTFNGGKSFCDIDVQSRTNYYLNFTLDENPAEFGYIYVLDFFNQNIGGSQRARIEAAMPKTIVPYGYSS